MQWTWTVTNFRRQWGTERPGVLQSVGLQSQTQPVTKQQQMIQKIKVFLNMLKCNLFVNESPLYTWCCSTFYKGYFLPPIYGFPNASVLKNPLANAGDMGSVLGSGRYPGEWNGNPLQYSCLENSMDRGACGPQSMGSQRATEHAHHNWATEHAHHQYIGIYT